MSEAEGAAREQRIDRWLWCARFFKSRTLAQKLAQAGRVRINRRIVDKASTPIRVGDVLTFPQAREIRVVRIVALTSRRGPAPEARLLYEDLTPPREAAPASAPSRERGAGRPTKRERRRTDRLRAADGTPSEDG